MEITIKVEWYCIDAIDALSFISLVMYKGNQRSVIHHTLARGMEQHREKLDRANQDATIITMALNLAGIRNVNLVTYN